MESFSFYNINKIIVDSYFFLSNCMIKLHQSFVYTYIYSFNGYLFLAILTNEIIL